MGPFEIPLALSAQHQGIDGDRRKVEILNWRQSSDVPLTVGRREDNSRRLFLVRYSVHCLGLGSVIATERSAQTVQTAFNQWRYQAYECR